MPRTRSKKTPSNKTVARRRRSGSRSRIQRQRRRRPLRGGVIAPRRDQDGRFRPNNGATLRTAIREMNTDRPAALDRYGPLRDWNTERVMDFSDAFNGFGFLDQGAGGTHDVTGWDTSAATSMKGMFANTNFNQPLNFDTHSVRDMNEMFSECVQFNQPLNFDTRAVTSMHSMFAGCVKFNQLLNFDTHNVHDMAEMFAACLLFNQPLNFDTHNVQDMTEMFFTCRDFNQPLNFQTHACQYLSNMFSDCTRFNQPINFDDTRAVIFMGGMFKNCRQFNQPINFDTPLVRNMTSMFSGCTTFNQPLNFNTHEVVHMDDMFKGCTRFNQPLNFDTHALETMNSMFAGCTAFNQPLHEWHHRPSEVPDLTVSMFEGCASFKSPVFTMSVVEYMDSKLSQTPLGQSALMQEALSAARHVQDVAMQGRMISSASVQAARALGGAPVLDAVMAAARARGVGGAFFAHRVDRDDYRPWGDENNERNVRPRR